jgi:AraC-like DNA-binding protein
MQVGWIDIINIIVIFQLFVFIFFIWHKRRSLSNKLLSLFFLAQALGIANYVIWRQRDLVYMNCPHLFHIGLPFILVWAPSLFLYVKSVVYRDFKFRPDLLVHFIPFFILSAYVLVRFHLYSAEVKRHLIDSNFLSTTIRNGMRFISQTQVIIYDSAALIVLKNYRARLKESYSSIDRFNLSWLSFILYGYIIACVFSLLNFIVVQFMGIILFNLTFIVYLIFFIFFNIIFYKAWSNPEIFSGVQEKIKYQASRLSKAEVEGYYKQVVNFMRNHQPFLQPDLTIKDLSEKLAISARHLSQVINQCAGQNFYDFVNSYRIEAAKKLFNDATQDRKTVLEILYSVGFNTKSAFNTAFKKHTGVTPTRFRKMAVSNIIRNP